jgi:formylglycine-generating enzyme required for sulfatase activity
LARRPDAARSSWGAGVYDLSGNVFEFEDSCTGYKDQNDVCPIRGGAFSAFSGQLTCDAPNCLYRFQALEDVGFRCCSD